MSAGQEPLISGIKHEPPGIRGIARPVTQSETTFTGTNTLLLSWLEARRGAPALGGLDVSKAVISLPVRMMLGMFPWLE